MNNAFTSAFLKANGLSPKGDYIWDDGSIMLDTPDGYEPVGDSRDEIAICDFISAHFCDSYT